MFALIAAVCFFLKLIHVGGGIDWITIGLLALALHFLIPFNPFSGIIVRRGNE